MKKLLKKITAVLICLALLPTFSLNLDAANQFVALTDITNPKADVFQPGYEPDKAFDGIETDPNNCWHTPWVTGSPGFPHWIEASFTTPQLIGSLVYVARSATAYQWCTSCEVWASVTGSEDDLQKVAAASWPTRAQSAEVTFAPILAKLVRFVALSKIDTSAENFSFSASEIKFGLADAVPGMFDSAINAYAGKAQNVLDYAAGDVGSAAHQYPAAAYQALATARANILALLGTTDATAVYAAFPAVDAAISALLVSNKDASEDVSVIAPKFVMTAAASTQNAGYEAKNAIDGDMGTMWHTQWNPTIVPPPHYFTLDLGRKQLIDKIYIFPRQDGQSNGRILSGEIYAGDTADNLALVTAFAGTDTPDPAVVNISPAYAKVIQIKSLNGVGGYSSIAEINVYTYDRGFAAAAAGYQNALQALASAVVGGGIGEFTQADVNAFKTAIDTIYNLNAWRGMTNSALYGIRAQLDVQSAAFLEKARKYTLSDLLTLIDEGSQLLPQVADATDKAALVSSLGSAQVVADNTASTATEVHAAAVQLKGAVDMLKSSLAPVYSLAGQWNLKLGDYSADGNNIFSQTVNLPGSLDENKKGSPNTVIDMQRLSRYYKYTGHALYQKDLYVPHAWNAKEVRLFIERTRVTRVWVNGVEVLSPDRYQVAVSHTYDLSAALNYGAVNSIIIDVDNNLGAYSAYMPSGSILSGHMATEETQTNWNGILGRFELQMAPKVSITSLRAYSNVDLSTAKVAVDVVNNSAADFSGTIDISSPGLSVVTQPVTVAAGAEVTVTVDSYPMGQSVKLWSEFDRSMYSMTAAIEGGDVKSIQFGMRRLGVDPATSQLTINGQKTFLRSEANCAVFPLTAYAPMDEAGWEHLFGTYKAFGINAVRFHSWCPPDAAFTVADRLGLYLQPELSCWNAGSMFGTAVERSYYHDEIMAELKMFANHPSFCLFTFGNELVYNPTVIDGMTGIQYADSLLASLEATDPTRFFAFGSNVNYGNQAPTAHSMFYTAQTYTGTALRGAFAGPSGFVYDNYPSTTVNYNSAVAKGTAAGKPVHSFEVGQFQVFPDVLSEISQYTGVLEPRNFEATLQKLHDKGISDAEIKTYIDASGMLSRIGYREEIEAALRTTNMSGISLLGIQDFPGQGTALVGMVNALGDPKPYGFANPSDFSHFYNSVVPLAILDKLCWKSSETLNFNTLLANFGPSDLTGALGYTMAYTDGTIFSSGALPSRTFAQGSRTSAGSVSIPLAAVTQPSQFKLTLSLGAWSNTYDIWVYPETVTNTGRIYVADYLDAEAQDILNQGGSVLISPPATTSSFPNSLNGQFAPAFWSTIFAAGTLGLYINNSHPVFSAFPTEYFSNFQWYAMAKYGRQIVLDGITDQNGNPIKPIVKVIDGFTTLRNIGMLFEAKVGNGKLMVSSLGFEQLKDTYPEAKALRDSIIKYMNSADFNPSQKLKPDDISTIVTGTPKALQAARNNVALISKGGVAYLGPNTADFQGGYDGRYPDRLMEINDGIIDLSVGNRSWTDWNSTGTYPNDATVGVTLNKDYYVNEINVAFYEDSGVKAASNIIVQYWDGSTFVNVKNQSKTTGFSAGENSIKFDPVTTSKIQVLMQHQAKMGLAVTEFMVFESTLAASVMVSGLSNKAQFDVANGSSAAVGFNMIIAAYDAAGRLAEVYTYPRSVNPGDTLSERIPIPTNCPVIKAYIWSDAYVPLCPAGVLTR